MTLTGERLTRLGGRLAMLTVWASPFLFGAIDLHVWPPLAVLWMGLGALVATSRKRHAGRLAHDTFPLMPRVMIALHLLFAVQMAPLPPSLLRLISPGSYAAHFIPPPPSPAWAPLTASPTGTFQAWLFIAGLQGLVIAIFGGLGPDRAARMQRLFLGMSAAGALLSLEGLVQSKSAHPYWLYSVLRVPGAGAHEAGIYGPYLNRDHFSNLIAMAGSVAAALLALAARDGAFKNLSSFAKSERFGRNVGLLIALFLILVASAASGSRGGLIALGVGLLVGLGPVLVARPRLGLAACGLFALALFGAGAPDAFVRMTDIDFEVSRLLVWRDVVRLIEFFPVFGCGLGAFAPAYWPYQRVVRFEYWSHAHNEYLQALLEGGIAGILLGAYALRLGWIALPRIIRNAEARPALAGLAAAMTHAFVDSGFRVPANAAWASLLLICAVVRPSGKTEGDA